jgi:hypothetical protein
MGLNQEAQLFDQKSGGRKRARVAARRSLGLPA